MSDVIRQLEARSNFGNQQITRGLSEVPGSVTVRRASIWKRPRLRVKAAKWDSSASISCHGGDNGQLPPDGGSTVFWEDPEDDRQPESNAAIRTFCLVSWILQLRSRPAFALLGVSRKRETQPPATADSLLELSWPILKNLGFSGLVGVATGVAFKAVGKVLALLFGTMFAMLQVGVYLGYVTVDWSRVHKDVLSFLDINSDGEVEASEVKTFAAKCVAILSQGLPSGGGFCLGLGVGLHL